MKRLTYLIGEVLFMASLRQNIIVNWKMHKTIDESLDFVQNLSELLKNSSIKSKIFLAPPFTAIHPIIKEAEELKKINNTEGLPFIIGAQNMNDATEGAFTGEIAAKMLVDLGAGFVILGHSERRHVFNESNEFINKKLKRALEDGLLPILCVGETDAQREKGEMEQVLKAQITESLAGVDVQVNGIVLAYEPVWAIGTGKTASPEEAQVAHNFCRGVLKELYGEEIADSITIQYGGSVKPNNARSLIDQSDINGLLIGGASLDPKIFFEIINAVESLVEVE